MLIISLPTVFHIEPDFNTNWPNKTTPAGYSFACLKTKLYITGNKFNDKLMEYISACETLFFYINLPWYHSPPIKRVNNS